MTHATLCDCRAAGTRSALHNGTAMTETGTQGTNKEGIR